MENNQFIRPGKMRVIKIICVLCALSYFPVAPAQADDRFEQAQNQYFSGNLSAAADLFNSLAKQGNAESQYYLGLIYITDTWTGYDVHKGAAYLQTAADQNHIMAMRELGQLHETGAGFEKNLLRALDWYRKSDQMAAQTATTNVAALIPDMQARAKSGDINAQMGLAKYYDDGQSTEPDQERALHWYLKAAQQGNQNAMLMVGYFYCRGLGTEIKQEKASQWLKKSNRQALCN